MPAPDCWQPLCSGGHPVPLGLGNNTPLTCGGAKSSPGSQGQDGESRLLHSCLSRSGCTEGEAGRSGNGLRCTWAQRSSRRKRQPGGPTRGGAQEPISQVSFLGTRRLFKTRPVSSHWLRGGQWPSDSWRAYCELWVWASHLETIKKKNSYLQKHLHGPMHRNFGAGGQGFDF